MIHFTRTRFAFLALLVGALLLVACGEPPTLQPQATGDRAAATEAGAVQPSTTATTSAGASSRVVLPPGAPPDAEIVRTIATPGVRGGQLVLPLVNDPKTFNSLLVDSSSDQAIDNLQNSALYGYDNQLQKETPGLAKGWEYNERTREWTFHLRRGLRWSDGQPLTASDFIFATQVAFDPAVPNDNNLGLRLEPKPDSPPYEFRAPDPHTLVVKIPGVDAFAFLNLGNLRPLPRHALEKIWKAGHFSTTWGQDVKPEDLVVSGPYKLKQLRPGQSVIFERNPHYWRYDAKGRQLPYIDRLVMVVVKDLEAQELRFLAGNFDILDASQGGSGIKPDNLARFQDEAAKGRFKLIPLGPGFDTNYFAFNTNRGGTYTTTTQGGGRLSWQPGRRGETPPPDLKNYKPFVDPVKLAWFINREFRIACAELTNRKKIIDNILYGQGVELFGPIAAADKVWHNAKIIKHSYNPEAAKKRLDKLGFIDRNGDGLREDAAGNTLRIAMMTNRENNIREKVIQLLKADFRAAGIDLQPEIQDFNTLVTKLNATFDYDAVLLGFGSGVPNHPAMSSNVLPSAGRMHYGYPSQKFPATQWEGEVDSLYNQLKLTFDQAEQRKIFFRLQEVFAREQGAIHLFSPTVTVAARNRVAGLRPAVLRGSLIHNIDELYIKP